jgi:hypothetical protein
MKEKEVPKKVRVFARAWAGAFVARHPKWQTSDIYRDDWTSKGDYDLNLYVEDGRLSVCAYPLTFDPKLGTVADFSQLIVLVEKGRVRGEFA